LKEPFQVKGLTSVTTLKEELARFFFQSFKCVAQLRLALHSISKLFADTPASLIGQRLLPLSPAP